jgi:hypothetical protein
MSTPYRLGENAKLYYSTTALTATGGAVGTEAPNIKSVKVGGKRDTPEYSTRANGGTKSYATSMKDPSITFEIKVPGAGSTDAAFTAFSAANDAGTEIAVWALTASSTDAAAIGPAGNFVVSDFTMDQNNSTVIFATVELKPSSFNFTYGGSSSSGS